MPGDDEMNEDFELREDAHDMRRQQDARRWQALLDWQFLHDWALGKPQGTIVGTSCTNTIDPIAKYLNEVTGLAMWSVGPSIVCGDGRGITLKKPNWIKRLIKLVDTPVIRTADEPTFSPQYTKERDPQQITREQFLRYLEAVKP